LLTFLFVREETPVAKAGREFEVLVARIERRLSPMGAVIKSPDRLPDKITGQLREVDASIRYQTGNETTLVTIECRDRASAQDITWLEQIKSKKESIGADQTIVVSRRGFTEPAQLYAQHHGLLLRKMTDVTEEFILQCLRGLKVFIREIRTTMISYNIGFTPAPEDAGLSQLSVSTEVEIALEKNLPFATSRDGSPVSLSELYDEALPAFRDRLSELVDEENRNNAFGAQIVEKNAELDVYCDGVTVETVRGPRLIELIIFGVKCIVVHSLLPSLTPVRYSDQNNKVLESFSTTKDPESNVNINVRFNWDAL
jgi:hypothetical protein